MNELVIDCFAGGGGASTGIEAAMGRPIDLAINHDPAAIAMHLVNHPDTKHIIEDIFVVDPVAETQGRPVGLAWFSPDCTHHSRAKGGKPRKKKIRGLAWVVIRWAKKVKPRVILLENVCEFAEWGPLDENDQPCKRRKGMTFRQWVGRLRGLGYKVEYKELVAADYGVPTIRKRLYLVARCDGEPIVWPEPTHGPGRANPYRTAAECIDWSIPCPSIFDRKKPLVENTLRRIAKGLKRYVIEAKEPFIVAIDNKSSGAGPVYSAGKPLRTIVTENRFALVEPYLSKYHGIKNQEDRCQQVVEPIKTLDTQNRFALVEAFLVKHFGGAVGKEIDYPFPTITARGTQNQITTAFLTKYYNTNIGSDMRKPVPTVTATGLHIGEVRAFLVKYYNNNAGQSLNKPMHTITSKHRLGLVTVAGEDYQIVDIGMRMLQPRELARAQGFPDSYYLTGSKTNQVRMIGNSVCPKMAKVIAQANYRADSDQERKENVA